VFDTAGVTTLAATVQPISLRDIGGECMTCGNSKLSYRFYEGEAVPISGLGISTIANDIDLLLGYIGPQQVMYQGWLVYV